MKVKELIQELQNLPDLNLDIKVSNGYCNTSYQINNLYYELGSKFCYLNFNEEELNQNI